MASKNGNPGACDAGAKRVSSEVRRPLYTPARAATLDALKRNLAQATSPELRARLAAALATLEGKAVRS